MQKFNEAILRPIILEQYQGQEKIKKALSFYIKAAQMRGECLDHILIYGPSGLGKTTLANIIANEMRKRIIAIAAPTIKKVKDIIDLLTQLKEGQILFIDEIHRLPIKIEEILYMAMEDFVIDIDDEDIKERIELPYFTLIGATTAMGMLSEPMRNRFQINLELTPYEEKDMIKIIQESAYKIGGFIDEDCAKEVARRSRGIPRVANGFIRRIQDFAMVTNDNFIDMDVVEETFDFLGIDKNGFNNQDIKYLKLFKEIFGEKPVGIDTLAAVLNEDKNTIEKAIEPYLIHEAFIIKTPRGRILTKKAFKYLKEIENN